MNARKAAWRLMYGEILRRRGAESTGPDPGAVLDAAHAAGVTDREILIECAGFAAVIFAKYTLAPIALANEIDASVMAEPD